jgi:hypothetical protein
MSDTATTDRTRAIADLLTAHPEGVTVRSLANEVGVSTSTAAKALSILEADGSATRTLGPANGKRKSADIWRPVTTDTSTDLTTDTQTAPDTGGANEATDTPTPSDAPASGTAANDAPADEVTVSEKAPNQAGDHPATTATDDSSGEATPDDPATSGGPDTSDNGTGADTPADPDGAAAPNGPTAPARVANTPREPDLKVLIMAGVLGGHPDGITAADAIAESGLAPATGDTILAAMEVAGAAHRLPVTADGIELWVRGDGDLAAVDPANAPTHVTCPTCGHTRRVRRPSASTRRPGGVSRATGEVNSDGSQKLAKNGLRTMVEAFMRDLGAGVGVTPGTVGRELGGRSSGAVLNAMTRLCATGVLDLMSEAPVTYALAATAPAPTADVAAFMTGPVIKTDATTADDTTTTTSTDAA